MAEIATKRMPRDEDAAQRQLPVARQQRHGGEGEIGVRAYASGASGDWQVDIKPIARVVTVAAARQVAMKMPLGLARMAAADEIFD